MSATSPAALQRSGREPVPFFTSPVPSATSTAAWASQDARHNRCCMPCGVSSPAHSAIVQQFLRGRSDNNSPSTNCPARSWGSTPGEPAGDAPHGHLERLPPTAGNVLKRLFVTAPWIPHLLASDTAVA